MQHPNQEVSKTISSTMSLEDMFRFFEQPSSINPIQKRTLDELLQIHGSRGPSSSIISPSQVLHTFPGVVYRDNIDSLICKSRLAPQPTTVGVVYPFLQRSSAAATASPTSSTSSASSTSSTSSVSSTSSNSSASSDYVLPIGDGHTDTFDVDSMGDLKNRNDLNRKMEEFDSLEINYGNHLSHSTICQ
jgi:hypothetical protein